MKDHSPPAAGTASRKRMKLYKKEGIVSTIYVKYLVMKLVSYNLTFKCLTLQLTSIELLALDDEENKIKPTRTIWLVFLFPSDFYRFRQKIPKIACEPMCVVIKIKNNPTIDRIIIFF